MFIVFEGCDGSGKTTVTRNVVEKMKLVSKKTIIATAEPSESDIGKFIKNILQEKIDAPFSGAITHLFIADRINHIEQIIKPAIDDGHIVFCDRYVPSTIVCQSAHKLNPTVSMRFMFRSFVNSMFDNYIVPNVTFYLKINFRLSKERIIKRNKRNEIYENDSFRKQIIKLYDHWFGDYWFDCCGEKRVLVDASKSVDEITNFCTNYLLENYKEKF
jgi:dTMP kinase